MNTTNNTHRTKAAFSTGYGWKWITWNNTHGNKHAAIVEKARELGAKGYDAGNAEHEEIGRWNFATQ